jgi:hypothetical protein
MARRCSIFRPEEVVWECASGCKCECGFRHQNHMRPGIYRTKFMPQKLSRAKKDKIWDFWQFCLERHSNRALTIASDRLPALTALASVVHDHTGSDYLAGLWRDNLVADLAGPQFCNSGERLLFCGTNMELGFNLGASAVQF